MNTEDTNFGTTFVWVSILLGLALVGVYMFKRNIRTCARAKFAPVVACGTFTTPVDKTE